MEGEEPGQEEITNLHHPRYIHQSAFIRSERTCHRINHCLERIARLTECSDFHGPKVVLRGQSTQCRYRHSGYPVDLALWLWSHWASSTSHRLGYVHPPSTTQGLKLMSSTRSRVLDQHPARHYPPRSSLGRLSIVQATSVLLVLFRRDGGLSGSSGVYHALAQLGIDPLSGFAEGHWEYCIAADQPIRRQLVE